MGTQAEHKWEILSYTFEEKTKRMVNEEMGGKTSKLSNQQVQRFVQLTQLQPYVIQQIYDAFIDRAGRNGR